MGRAVTAVAGFGSGVLVAATAVAVHAARGASARHRTTARAAAGAQARARRWALVAPAWVRRRLAQADLGDQAALIWTALVTGAAVGVPVAAVVGGPGLGAVLALFLAGGPLVALALVGDRRDRRIEARLPEVLEGVARALRSGASLRLALGEAAPPVPGALGEDLRAVVVAADAGLPLATALDGWVDRRPLPGVRLAVATLGLGAEAGGAQARALDGVAETLRGRLAVAAEVRALSSQARLSGLVIALAPLVFSGLATATDARTAEFLFRTPLGLGCLVLGIGLDAVAAAWMVRLCRVEA
jgi:tight adherence protein B